MRLFHWERTVHTELSLSLAVRAGASNNLRHLIRPVQIGETVRFDCGQHNTALYQWSVRYPATSEERPINLILNHRMRTLHGRTLSISNVQVDDSGNYTCQATNLEPIEFELKVYESNASRPECKQSYLAATALRYALTTAALIVLCSALFSSVPPCTVRLCSVLCVHAGVPLRWLEPDARKSEVIVQEGQNARFGCQATGYPDPHVFWTHAGRAVDKYDDHFQVTLANVKVADAGEWSCTVRTECPGRPILRISNSFQLIVSSASTYLLSLSVAFLGGRSRPPVSSPSAYCVLCACCALAAARRRAVPFNSQLNPLFPNTRTFYDSTSNAKTNERTPSRNRNRMPRGCAAVVVLVAVALEAGGRQLT